VTFEERRSVIGNIFTSSDCVLSIKHFNKLYNLEIAKKRHRNYQKTKWNLEKHFVIPDDGIYLKPKYVNIYIYIYIKSVQNVVVIDCSSDLLICISEQESQTYSDWLRI
jgi:hypothetical protein